MGNRVVSSENLAINTEAKKTTSSWHAFSSLVSTMLNQVVLPLNVGSDMLGESKVCRHFIMASDMLHGTPASHQ